MQHFQVFKHGNLTAVHRPGIVRFELDMEGAVVVGTIREIEDVAQADWNVGLIAMKLVFSDVLDAQSLDSWPENIAKHHFLENVMWLIGDRLANWMVEGELAMSMKEVGVPA